MPGTRTTQSVGPVLGVCYPVDPNLTVDESNLTDLNARVIVYNKALGLGKFDATVSDADGNERNVIVGATAAVAHASRHTIEEPTPTESQPAIDVRQTPNVSTPKKKKSNNIFETLYDAEEFPTAPPEAAAYSAPRASARLSEQRSEGEECMR